MKNFLHDKRIVVIGGCGHVGLPLGVRFALAGATTILVDIDAEAVKTVNTGMFPFMERRGDEQLSTALERGLTATTSSDVCNTADVVVFATATTLDNRLDPQSERVEHVFNEYVYHLAPGTLAIMRSTLSPGTMDRLRLRSTEKGLDVRLAYCPERIAQGFALEEIVSLPQIVAAFDDETFDAAYRVFAAIAPSIIRLTPLETELAKLMHNAWRFMQFAIANQFYMTADQHGVDFSRIYRAMCYKYPRAEGYKQSGFAAGPCLLKDTRQLAACMEDGFGFGHAALLVNEGLATFVVNKTAKALGGTVKGKTVGLLGMAFKANCDDTRDSLSYKVKADLEKRGARVMDNDPHVSGTQPLEKVLAVSDALILCVPHADYKSLKTEKPIVDAWFFLEPANIEILPGTENI